MKFLLMREGGKHKKAYMTDYIRDVGERVEGSIHKATGRLEAHFLFTTVDDWIVEEAAIRGVIGMLEYVYLPVELKAVAESGEEQLKVVEAPNELRAYGAKKKLGDLLFKLLFETPIDMLKLAQWMKSDKDLHTKFGMLLEKMARAGVDMTRMQKLSDHLGLCCRVSD